MPGTIKLTNGLAARLYWNKVSLILALQRKGIIAVIGSRHKNGKLTGCNSMNKSLSVILLLLISVDDQSHGRGASLPSMRYKTEGYHVTFPANAVLY